MTDSPLQKSPVQESTMQENLMQDSPVQVANNSSNVSASAARGISFRQLWRREWHVKQQNNQLISPL